MDSAIHIPGEFLISDVRQVLMHEQLQIPGLSLLGHYQILNAEQPLVSHYHKDCFEITYISKGVFTFSTETHDYRLTGGNLFITKPDEIHSTNLSPLSVGEIYWILLDCTKTEGILFLEQSATRHLLENLYKIPGHIIKTDSAKTEPLLQKTMKLALQNKNRYAAASCLSLFLQLLFEYNEVSAAGLTPDIGQSVDYILEHICEFLSIDELAASCNLSVSQFKHKFKDQMGISPRNFINYQKIELAKLLLLEEMDITKIAMELGFTTSSYFSTVFKRYTTFSPAEYRKQLKTK